MSLENLIVSEIRDNGPISIYRFMEACLYNDQFGYYTSKKNMIGATGDFITSPEISQVFGELIGAWLAQTWIDRGKPKPFNLVELGPGTGTLMKDILRILVTIPKLLNSVSIFLVETSPELQFRQATRLKNYSIQWIKSVVEIPESPTFVIANEFLDALPIRQFKKIGNVWNERAVDASENGKLNFTYLPSSYNNELQLFYSGVPNDVVIESSDAAKNVISILSEKILRNNGAALFIDYGYFEGFGDTLQAVCNHKYSNPLTNLGETDLTTQVNFKSVYDTAIRKGLRASSLNSQGDFLKGLGIQLRAESLAQKMTLAQKQLHFNAIDRLIKEDEMGGLFKVIGITTQNSAPLPILENL